MIVQACERRGNEASALKLPQDPPQSAALISSLIAEGAHYLVIGFPLLIAT